MNALIDGPLIAGLPAMDFFNREVKVKWRDGDPHPGVAKMVGIGNRGKIKVKYGPANRQTVEVSPHLILPFWSRNPDLQKRAAEAGLKAVEEQEESPEVKPTTEPPKPMPTPKTEAPIPTKKLKSVKASPEIGFEWVGTYQELQKLMGGIGAKRGLRDRIIREIAEEEQMIQLYTDELEKKGVEIEWE